MELTAQNEISKVELDKVQEVKVIPNPKAMPETVEAPVLAEFLDFRQYLDKWYRYRQFQTSRDFRPYNYAMFAAAANIKSPNYLKMIIDGQRNLSDDMVSKFAKALGLLKDQAEEFRLLVHFGQASDPAQRNLALKQLNEYRVDQKLKSGEISRDTWDKVPNWITWILYSMLDQDGAVFDAKKLVVALRGKATETEIENAIQSLLASGQVVRSPETGLLEKTKNLIDNPEEIPVALVRKLQSELMYLGLESLFRDSPTEREFGTVTLSLTKSEFEDLRFKLRQFRKSTQKDNSVKRASSKGERVYQLNLQLFPVTDRTTKA